MLVPGLRPDSEPGGPRRPFPGTVVPGLRPHVELPADTRGRRPRKGFGPAVGKHARACGLGMPPAGRLAGVAPLHLPYRVAVVTPFRPAGSGLATGIPGNRGRRCACPRLRSCQASGLIPNRKAAGGRPSGPIHPRAGARWRRCRRFPAARLRTVRAARSGRSGRGTRRAKRTARGSGGVPPRVQ